MRTDILEYLQKEVYARSKEPTNRFGMGCYYHIEAVVKNGELLAQKYGADKEIVMIAAWLHDIASITDYAFYENHHVYGAEIAYDILSKLSYEESKIKLVQKCIMNHRGSIHSNKDSVEELCVADADAVSHFDNVPSLLYLAYVERKMGMEEGLQFVKSKLERSFCKLSVESKEYYREKYRRVMGMLSGEEI
ncbi:MAG: HD domain-containing protein [Lachnospiraceae bacterium]|nr:HD domain-containing protein [Lachnospiraceae bacterium]